MFSAILMAVPFTVSIVFGEWEASYRYLYSIGIALIVGSLLRFCRIESGKLNRQQATAVVGLAWFVLGLACSVPLYFSGHYMSYLDAVFDGVSGITTTGACVITDLDHLSYADNMFRFIMHFCGGLGLVVVALSLGLFGRGAGASLYASEGRNEHVLPNVVQTTKFISKLTAGFIIAGTVIIFIFMVVSGIEPVRAALQGLWVSVSGFATGGFAPMQQSILYYHSFPIEVVLMILMLLGSIGFVLYSAVIKGRFQDFTKDIETRIGVAWFCVMAIVFTASLAASTLFGDLPTLIRRGTFMVIAAGTTTGYSVITDNQLLTVITSGAFLTLALLMAVGAGAGSTAGGIKLFRLGIIAKSVVASIKDAISPDSATVSVMYNHMGRRVLTASIVREATIVFSLYVGTYMLGVLVGIAHGFDAQSAIFESVAMTSNGGLSAGLVTPGMPATLEIFYIIQMWAGRLEFVTLLAVIVKIFVSLIPRKHDFVRDAKEVHDAGFASRPRADESRFSDKCKTDFNAANGACKLDVSAGNDAPAPSTDPSTASAKTGFINSERADEEAANVVEEVFDASAIANADKSAVEKRPADVPYDSREYDHPDHPDRPGEAG